MERRLSIKKKTEIQNAFKDGAWYHLWPCGAHQARRLATTFGIKTPRYAPPENLFSATHHWPHYGQVKIGAQTESEAEEYMDMDGLERGVPLSLHSLSPVSQSWGLIYGELSAKKEPEGRSGSVWPREYSEYSVLVAKWIMPHGSPRIG